MLAEHARSHFIPDSPMVPLQFTDYPFVQVRNLSNKTGAELVLWTSVEVAEDVIRITQTSGGFFVSMGKGAGIRISEESAQEKRRNQRLLRQLEEEGFATKLAEENQFCRLETMQKAASQGQALEMAGTLAEILVSKLGMELALANLQSVRPNVQEVTDRNLSHFFAQDKAVIFSELTQCIRCRQAFGNVIRLTSDFKDLLFGMVFLNKSRAEFKKRVFGREMPEIAASGIVAPTAFLIKDGRVSGYVGTRLSDPIPSPDSIEEAISNLWQL